ncbi:MAG: tetratricopeptide repeat protein, partial [Vicingaceae bacterium]
MKYLLYIILFLNSFNGVAQKYADKAYYLVDSLVLEELTEGDKKLIDNSLKKYHSAKEDSSQINALDDICENMMHDDWSKFQFYQYELIKKLLKTNKTKALKKSLANSLNNIGTIYNDQGDIPKAVEYYHKSFKIQEEIGDKEGIATSLNNIGYIYHNQGDIPKALEYYHKSLNIQEEIGDKEGIAISLNNIGVIYRNQGDIPKALEYNHKSLKIQEEIGNKLGIARSLNNIGMIYNNQEDIPKALTYFHKSLKIYEEIGNKEGTAYSLNNLGFNELKKGNTSGIVAAKQHLLKALEIAQEIGYPDLISKVSSNLSKFYEKQGKGMKALDMHQLHIQMRDSINNEATLKASIQQEAKYVFEKVQAVKDAAHEKQLAIEKEAKAKQQVITAATG